MKKFLLVLTITMSLVIGLSAEVPTPPDVPPNPELGGGEPEVIDSDELDARYELNIYRLVDRISRTYRVMNVHDDTETAAGELFTDLALVGDFSYASFNDSQREGSGHDRSEAVYLTGRFADDYLFGVGVSEYSYWLSGPLDLKQHMYTLDMYTVYEIMDNLHFGGFFQISHIDIEDSPISPTIGDSYERYGAGLIGSYRRYYELFSVGIASSISSFNKQTLNDIPDDEDSAWITVLDIEHPFTDNLSIDLYTAFYTLLDNTRNEDGTYWILGGDLIYRINEQWVVSGGYERPAGYEDYNEHRFNATVSYSW